MGCSSFKLSLKLVLCRISDAAARSDTKLVHEKISVLFEHTALLNEGLRQSRRFQMASRKVRCKIITTHLTTKSNYGICTSIYGYKFSGHNVVSAYLYSHSLNFAWYLWCGSIRVF